MRVLTASDRAMLIEAADLAEAMRVNVRLGDIPGIVERVPGARTVLVRFDPLRTSADAIAAAVASGTADAEPPSPTREVVLPVRYDGEDLEETARMLSVSPEELVRRHLAAEWTVAFSGFAPGFGYAVSGDPLFDVPRRSTPRTRVPAGSVGLAGVFSGVYPRESPGGWQLIGRTDTVMWDIDRDPPALLSPGTGVRFERADREVVRSGGGVRTPRRAEADDPRPRTPCVEVVRPALQLLVQDAGRTGFAALGVSSSGAADRRALHDANRAVGNAPTAAVLECVGSAVLRLHGSGVAVITGAEGELELVTADGGARPIAHGVPFATSEGDELHLGHPERGIRYVIGVRGGVAAASVLGSRATDTLAGLGPAPLVAGDVVGVGRDVAGSVEEGVSPRALPATGEVVELPITLGPRDDWFTPAALDALVSQDWLVTPRSDRVGVRLQGDRPLERAITGELPSEGAVAGALQVPPDGQPVLFGPDHPVTGGYPIIAALTDAALDTSGQLPPGARIRFRAV
ncbi:urea amidolyase family protein [Microbacterium sp. CIAB417]|uniref:5-oxoprolinase subunit B/C family protein n=1 Tax=Microbacterium sp. CIAB417 TaxID=2860287 RepID=UPI0024BF3531|nr:urea amidolyase family protein [Microbacterium sp. CIAB417]